MWRNSLTGLSARASVTSLPRVKGRSGSCGQEDLLPARLLEETLRGSRVAALALTVATRVPGN